jgi:hypothetical protein
MVAIPVLLARQAYQTPDADAVLQGAVPWGSPKLA